MEDYPQTLKEFEERFSSEDACLKYLEALRWREGFMCPRCKKTEHWIGSRGRRICVACGYQATVTVGTIFERTRMPLTLWFRAIWWVTNQQNGASALGLQRVLGLSSYETAWTCLHKLRHAMVRPMCLKLSGEVEVDETYLFGLNGGVRDRKTEKKLLIAVALEIKDKRIKDIRLSSIKDTSATSLHPFIIGNVSYGSVIHTDEWEGYSGIDKKRYSHNIVEDLPRIQSVVSLLNRWLMVCHLGAITHEHLDRYLDEFRIRFNHRYSGRKGKLFYRLIKWALIVDPITYEQITKHRQPKTEMNNL